MDDEFDINLNELMGDEEAPAESEASEEPSPPAPEAVSARKPGVLSRAVASVNQFFSRISLPKWNLPTFLYLLVVLIILVLLACNWPPVRIDLLVWRFDAPKSVVFIINLIIGAGLLRLWQIYARRHAVAQPAEQQSSSPNQI